MGNCFGKPTKGGGGGGQRLGSGSGSAAPRPMEMQPTRRPEPQAAVNTTSPSSAAAASDEEARRIRAEAAERRLAGNTQRGIQNGGGALASQLERTRQLSDRELREQEVAKANRANGNALNWTVS
ncbi:hypothetical protein H9P43_001293 [Blastocladiella emersonii ATCC 22665]|nr:hypothetical protein H9P43_001289 [Blastocladiella emersonii ATCC 22665]KAI9189860.1 hypothetical protein H9P43_001293 [Blastocladiella emersonii ATCC 22665]